VAEEPNLAERQAFSSQSLQNRNEQPSVADDQDLALNTRQPRDHVGSERFERCVHGLHAIIRVKSIQILADRIDQSLVHEPDSIMLLQDQV
jgi:hypothetical protein